MRYQQSTPCGHKRQFARLRQQPSLSVGTQGRCQARSVTHVNGASAAKQAIGACTEADRSPERQSQHAALRHPTRPSSRSLQGERSVSRPPCPVSCWCAQKKESSTLHILILPRRGPRERGCPLPGWPEDDRHHAACTDDHLSCIGGASGSLCSILSARCGAAQICSWGAAHGQGKHPDEQPHAAAIR